MLSRLADAMAAYIIYQIDSGAQCVQIFDSWGGQLPPRDWDKWSGPYLKRMVTTVKTARPRTPLTLYANGSGGLLERLKATGVDVVGLDWTVDMGDARRRLGSDVAVQVGGPLCGGGGGALAECACVAGVVDFLGVGWGGWWSCTGQ